MQIPSDLLLRALENYANPWSPNTFCSVSWAQEFWVGCSQDAGWGEGLKETEKLLPRWRTHLLLGRRFNSSSCGTLLCCVWAFQPGLWLSLEQEFKENQRKRRNALYGFISKVTQYCGWGLSSVSRISAWHAQSPGFDLYHHVNWGWEVEAENRSSRSSSTIYQLWVLLAAYKTLSQKQKGDL